MSKKKPRKRILKIVLLVLAGLAAAFGLFAAYFFLSLPDTASLEKKNPTTTALIEMRKAEALKKKTKIYPPPGMGRV